MILTTVFITVICRSLHLFKWEMKAIKETSKSIQSKLDRAEQLVLSGELEKANTILKDTEIDSYRSIRNVHPLTLDFWKIWIHPSEFYNTKDKGEL